MTLAVTLATLALTCGLAGWFAARELPFSGRFLSAALLAALGMWSVVIFSPRSADAELDASLPTVGPMEDYSSSDSCRACHPGQYQSWHDTFHRTMTQVATPETVKAPFDGRIVEERGGRFRLYERDGRFHAESLRTGKHWRIVMLTGSHNLQAFWVRLDDGRLSQFPFVYLLREGRWLANSDSFLQPEYADDAPYEEYIWTDGCVSCHSTGGPWDPAEIEANVSTPQAVTELGIACEACHGPAREHVMRNRDPSRRYALHRNTDGDDTIVNPSRLEAARAASICGRCHTVANHRENDPGFFPGALLSDSLDHEQLWERLERHAAQPDPEMIDGEERDQVESFWLSGAVRVAGREYDGMIRSECYLEDEMSCISCHQVHGGTSEKQLPPDNTDQQMCGSCHEEVLADVSAHTHHEADGVGSQCTSCHMPYTSYGLLMATRSHRLDSPVASGWQTRGAPNACNLCHQDRSLGWTAERLEEWYGRPSPPIPEDARDVPAGALWLLRGDAVQRALTAWHLRQEWVAETVGADAVQGLEPHLITLLGDPVSAVRQVGARTLQLRHPEWELDIVGIAAHEQAFVANRLRGRETGITDHETFERLWAGRLDYPVTIPE